MRKGSSRCRAYLLVMFAVLSCMSVVTVCGAPQQARAQSSAQASAQVRASAPPQDQKLALEIFRQLIEIDTTHSAGSVTVAAEAMRDRLLAGGFPAEDVTLAGPSERKQNLIARFRGQGNRNTVRSTMQGTIVFFAHLDVVEAQRSDWSVDPFRFIEKDGYYYGRGTQDI